MFNPFSTVPAVGTYTDYTEEQLRDIRHRATMLNRIDLIAWQTSPEGEKWFTPLTNVRRPEGFGFTATYNPLKLADEHTLVQSQHPPKPQHYV